MKKYIAPLFAGIFISYCFASMVLNMRIVNPVIAMQNKSHFFSRDELVEGLKDFEIVTGNQLRSTSKDPWIEVSNIRERVGKLRSVTYKIKIIDEEDELKTELFYSDAEQDYNGVRKLTSVLNKDTVIIAIPDYVGQIDKLRLDLIGQNDTIIEVDEISLNMNERFSAPLMLLIYTLWCLVIFLELRTPKEESNIKSRHKSTREKPRIA